MYRRAGVVAVVAAATIASAQWTPPPPPPPPPPYPGQPFNVTVYHVNERSYGAAPIDMNTADLHGDMFFDLRSKALALECAGPAGHKSHDCLNPEVAPPEDDPLVVTKLVLTIMAPFGPYGRCNVCFNHTTAMGDKNCTNGEYVCDCGGWGTPGGCTAAVGWENVSAFFGRFSRCRQGSPDFECWRDKTLAKTVPPGENVGVWYSTTKAGYGKTWKVAQVVKRVSKQCSDSSINEAVERAGFSTGCFQACGPHSTGPSRNVSDPCWIRCFEQTVLGPDAAKPDGPVAGMPLSDLVKAWEAPFASSSLQRGGCPALPTPPVSPPPPSVILNNKQ